MKCPRCEHKTSVIDSRETGHFGWRRRRSCPACGYRFSTKEVSGEIIGNLLKENKTLKKQKEIYEAALGLDQSAIARQVKQEINNGGFKVESDGGGVGTGEELHIAGNS